MPVGTGFHNTSRSFCVLTVRQCGKQFKDSRFIEYNFFNQHLKNQHANLREEVGAIIDDQDTLQSVKLRQVQELVCRATLRGTLQDHGFRFMVKDTDKWKRTVRRVIFNVRHGLSFVSSDDILSKQAFAAGCGCGNGCASCSVYTREYQRQVAPEIAMALTNIIRNEFAEQGILQLSTTADGWSANNGDKFMAITGHYTTPGFEVRCFLLDFFRIPFGLGDHRTLRTAIEQSIETWKTGHPKLADVKDFIASITTDNESATTLAAAEFMGPGAEEDTCFAHTVNLAARKLLAESAVQTLITKVKKCCTLLLHSQAKHAVDVSNSLRKPITGCDTRWTGDYLMLRRYQELYPHIERAAEKGRLDNYDTAQWCLGEEEKALMNTLIVLMRPLEEVIRLSEGENYVSLAFVPQWINDVLHALVDDANDCKVAKGLRKRLREDFARRMQKYLVAKYRQPTDSDSDSDNDFNNGAAPIADASAALCCAALHPRFFHLPWLSDDEREIVDKVIERLALEHMDSIARNSPDAARTSTLKEYFKAFLQEHPQLDTDPNVVASFWARPIMTYHPVQPVARCLLAIPATSAPSERVFSCAGFVQDRGRCLAPASLRARTLIRFNFRHAGPATTLVDRVYRELLHRGSLGAVEKNVGDGEIVTK